MWNIVIDSAPPPDILLIYAEIGFHSMKSMKARPGSAGRIQSVSRALMLLKLVAKSDEGCTGKSLAEATGLAVPTAHHLLGTLTAHGMLARGDRACYVLGPSLAALADAYYRNNRPPEYLLRPLRQLVEKTGETGYLAAWRHSEIELLAVVDGALTVRVAVPTGPYRDAHARASGKLLLAFAPQDRREAYLATHPLRQLTPRTTTRTQQLARQFAEIRESGYAVEREEFVTGVSCVAAPVIQDDAAIASYALSIPSERFRTKKTALISDLLDATRSACRSVPLEVAP